MSEILTLAETFKQKSDKTAESINKQIDSVIETLNESMTAKLEESGNIIKTGTADLSKQDEQLQLMLTKHRDNIHTALSSYTSEVQALIGKGLSDHTKEVQTMIQSHTETIETTIQEAKSTTYQAIKSDMNKWAILGGIATFIILLLGLLMGIGIAKKVIKPTVIYYEQTATTQPYIPYNP